MDQALSSHAAQPAERGVRWYDYITTNIYFLGLSTVAQTMSPLVLPLLVQRFVGEAQKASYYGSLRLWSLMVALLAQALWGMLSDRSTARWGRRRPFIFGGTVADLVFIFAIASLAGVSGIDGYTVLLALVLILQVSSNAAQAAQQALIPDLIPESLRGRFSAVKAIFEVPLPVILVSFTIGRLIGRGNMWGGILVMSAVLVGSMLLTMLVREQPLRRTPAPLNWAPLLRLVLMTAIFTAIILGMGAAVRFGGDLLQGVTSVPVLLAVMGVLGLLGMGVAVALGVWVSVRISVGAAAAAERPGFTWWVVNRLAFLVGVTNLSTFAVFFLQARLGYERDSAAGPAANMLLFVGIAIMIFALVGGWLADRFGHKRVVAAAGVIAFLGTMVAISLPSLGVIYVGASIIGIATGLFYTANWALGTELVPKEEAGRYLGISNLAGAGAGAIGAYIGGPIADYFTARVPEIPGLGYVLLFVIYGVLFLLSVLALARVRK